MSEPTNTDIVQRVEQSEPEDRLMSDDVDRSAPDDSLMSDGVELSAPDETETAPRSKEELYRKQRAELRAENEKLVARLDRLHRAEVERIAAAHLEDGSDFWKDGATLADVLNDDGDVDTDRVAETAKALIANHSHWVKRSPAAIPASHVTGNGKIGDGHDDEPTTWSNVLQTKKLM